MTSTILSGQLKNMMMTNNIPGIPHAAKFLRQSYPQFLVNSNVQRLGRDIWSKTMPIRQMEKPIGTDKEFYENFS